MCGPGSTADGALAAEPQVRPGPLADRSRPNRQEIASPRPHDPSATDRDRLDGAAAGLKYQGGPPVRSATLAHSRLLPCETPSSVADSECQILQLYLF